MNIYYIIFIILFLFSFVEILDRKTIRKLYPIIIPIIGLFFIVFGGLRANGFDYDMYEWIYKNLSFKDRADFLVEFGFVILVILFKFLSFSFNAFLFCLTAFCVIVKLPVIKKHSPYVLLSLLIYFPLTFIMSDMGQIRNSISLTIIFWAYSDLFENKERKFIIKVLIAGIFHNSALIVLPIYLIVKNINKISPWVLYTLIVCILPLLFIDSRDIFMQFNSFLPEAFSYKVVAYTESEEYGQRVGLSMTFLLRVIVLIGLFGFRIRGTEKYTYYPLILNLYLAGVIVFILFNSVEQFAVRFTNYFKMLEYFILPMFITLTKNKEGKFLIYLLVCAYAFWSLYKLMTIPEMAEQLLPYKSILF